MSQTSYPLLSKIDLPEDLRALEPAKLKPVADELRAFLIESVSATGGHFSSCLGTVELTVALHYVFNTPDDRLVWDVGHQSYPHKILTGRRELMHSIRQRDGLSGFPKRDESEFDTFGVGHSSTSISAALGMALAAKQQGSERESIAIIGDGAMTAGMAYEALNHAGDLDAKLLVILNDNEMSISPNVGAMNKYLSRVLSGKIYGTMRKGSKKFLKPVPGAWEFARRAEEHVKGMVIPGTLFEEMGFNYFGPIDGHDVNGLVKMLHNLKQLDGPRMVHVITQKGHGYRHAEEDPCGYHGVSKFDPSTGIQPTTKTGKETPTYTQVFSKWLCDMAATDELLVGITPAMREGSGLVAFAEHYPNRYFDVGIAEQHAVTLAAGMACDNAKPVVAIYSTFLQRAYDQLIHDVAIQNLDVTFAIDRAGVVGPDGATHAGSFDLSYLRCVPNMVVMTPSNEKECRQMLSTGFKHQGPAAIRYPRGKGPGVLPEKALDTLPIGKGDIVRAGKDIALLAFGCLVSEALAVGDELNASVVNMRFVKPLDTELIDELLANHDLLVTLEDNVIQGGAGSAVNEYLNTLEKRPRVLNLGLPDRFQHHGTREELLHDAGLDSSGIKASISATLSKEDCQARA